MDKPDKKKKISIDELIEKFEEFAKKNDLKEVTKEEFEENIKKISSPKRDKK